MSIYCSMTGVARVLPPAVAPGSSSDGADGRTASMPARVPEARGGFMGRRHYPQRSCLVGRATTLRSRARSTFRGRRSRTFIWSLELRSMLKIDMVESDDFQQLKELGAGRLAPEAVACLYQQAFREFGTQALWSRRPSPKPTIAQALVVADALRREGNLRSRKLAVEIEQACRAAL